MVTVGAHMSRLTVERRTNRQGLPPEASDDDAEENEVADIIETSGRVD